MKTKLTLSFVRSELHTLGYSIKRTIDSEYVSYPTGTNSDDTGYFSDCLQDHLDTVKSQFRNDEKSKLNEFNDFIGKEVFIITGGIVMTVTLEKVVTDKRDFILMFEGGHVLINKTSKLRREGSMVLQISDVTRMYRLVLA